MNINTGREFNRANPQDDPHLYAPPPPGFTYRYDGTLVAVPLSAKPKNISGARLNVIKLPDIGK